MCTMQSEFEPGNKLIINQKNDSTFLFQSWVMENMLVLALGLNSFQWLKQNVCLGSEKRNQESNVQYFVSLVVLIQKLHYRTINRTEYIFSYWIRQQQSSNIYEYILSLIFFLKRSYPKALNLYTLTQE